MDVAVPAALLVNGLRSAGGHRQQCPLAFEIRRERADAAVRAVRGDEQRVEPKELRNFRPVVRQIFVERRARGHAGLLQLDDHQRQAVDETDQIRAAGVERAGDGELADSRKSLFAGCSQSITLNRSGFCPLLLTPSPPRLGEFRQRDRHSRASDAIFLHRLENARSHPASGMDREPSANSPTRFVSQASARVSVAADGRIE